jgi:hypothetical protein
MIFSKNPFFFIVTCDEGFTKLINFGELSACQ